MKRLLIKLFGVKWYCRQFHTHYESRFDKTMWHCNKCNISFKKRPSDGSTGPP